MAFKAEIAIIKSSIAMIKKILFYLVLSLPILTYSQNCTNSCTWTVFSSDTSSYTINTGQTLCIQTNGVVKGSIVLAGGLICSSGVINPSSLICTSGSISNYGTLMYNGNLALTTNGFSLVNNTGATLNVLGTLTNAGASISNQGTVNITQSITMSDGSISNSGTMNYLDINKTGGTNENTGTVNCCGN